MIKANLKLLAIALGCLTLSVFALVVVRWMGLQQAFMAPPHPWLERPFWWVYVPPPDQLCTRPDLLADLPDKDWIVTVPVRRQGEDWLVVCGPPQNQPVKPTQGKQESQLTLVEFLNRNAQVDLLIDVLAHDTWSLDKLVEIVGKFDDRKHFAITSEAQKVGLFLRKSAPQWLFAADSSTLLRLRLFESLWIEPAMEFRPDFVISSLSAQANHALDARGAAELNRRKKRIIWQWDGQDGEATNVPPFAIQGIMTTRPSAARQKMK